MIANGSEKSYVDRNGNGYIDPSDAHDNIPVAMEVRYNTRIATDAVGGGRIIFVSDTAMFSNDLFVDLSNVRNMMGDPTRYTAFCMSKLQGSNKAFDIALVEYMLPSGGKVVFDESRHPQAGYEAAVYDSITSLTIVTSNPLEAGLLSVGILLILFVLVVRARDKESWIHRFDISSVHRRAVLPDTRTVQVEHLKKALMAKLRMLNSLSIDELHALTPAQMAAMIKDHDLNELLLDEQKTYTPEEIRMVTTKLRAWGKA
jgi:hypothetical protein